MSRIKSFFTLILGIFLGVFVHFSIRRGHLLSMSRHSDKKWNLDDPEFWSTASYQMSAALVLIILSLIYLLTGCRYLPEVDKGKQSILLLYSAVGVLGVYLLSLAMRLVLPDLYT